VWTADHSSFAGTVVESRTGIRPAAWRAIGPSATLKRDARVERHHEAAHLAGTNLLTRVQVPRAILKPCVVTFDWVFTAPHKLKARAQ